MFVARNTSFLESLIKIYWQKDSPKQSTEYDSNPAGVPVCVKCFDYMLLWAGLQSIERR